MSDLSETVVKSFEFEDRDEILQSYAHLQTLIIGGKAKLSEFIRIAYPKGWYGIVETMMQEIKRYPIELDKVGEYFGELDVRFVTSQRTHEARVWRAIDKARRNSVDTCQQCGALGERKILGNKITVQCHSCIEAAEQSLKTGTWLDKY